MGQIMRVSEEIALPLPLPGKKIDYGYIRILIGEINKALGQETNTTLNLLLGQTGDTNIRYLGGVPDENGIYPVGTWRERIDDEGRRSIERKITDGSWSVRRRTT